MPRKKKVVDPATLLKQMPKTKAVAVTGSCGHTTKERFFLGYQSWGADRPEAWSAWELQKNDIRREAALDKCKDCFARDTIAEAKKANDAITDFLGLPPLPAMDNSVRMAAFAEGNRVNLVRTDVSNLSRYVSDRLKAETLIDHLLLGTLRAAWPNDLKAEDGLESGSPDLVALQDEALILAKEVHVAHESIARIDFALAFWLLLRKHFMDAYVFQEGRSKVWISAARSSRRGNSFYDRPPMDASVFLAGILVSQLTCWETREEAWKAFNELQEWAPTGMASFVADEIRNSTPLPDIISGIHVANALNGVPSHSRVPWDF